MKLQCCRKQPNCLTVVKICRFHLLILRFFQMKIAKVNRVKAKEYVFMGVLTIAVTAVFYFILQALGTSNLVISTLSISTSFIPAYLTFRRRPYYALGYAANDVVLMVLWMVASFENSAYLPVTVCFTAFLVNDLYGFICWRKMQKRQEKGA